MIRTHRPRALTAVVLAVTAVLPLSACGGSAGAAPANTRPADLQLVQDGVLTVGIDATYPPMEYREGGQLEGVNAELLTDLAKRLGLKAEFEDVAFADLRPAAAAHTIDVVGSSMTDKADRQADVDFVDYFVAGAQVLVASDGPDLTSPSSWCGRRGASTGGTTDGDIILAQSQLCARAGQPPVTFVDVPYTKSVDEVLAGRADFGVEDLPAAVYLAANSGGKIKVLGDQLQPQPYGYGFAKDRTALRDALQRALQDAIADGTYDRILKKYDVAGGALKSTSINGGA
ncbi:ABC transporter substrate-binding protein [Quadrisphaera setariae]|uniref:ABC transporter substrate-binding protein n=1 Tax=Quadrisphaera setariae TaxID=2593304 RepID=UPI0016502DE7|nr:ABC transporter substrate-binding protein [Quadrisphaera setariae]